MPEQNKTMRFWIAEELEHCVDVELDPSWLDKDGDITDEGFIAATSAAMDKRCDATVEHCRQVNVIETEMLQPKETTHA